MRECLHLLLNSCDQSIINEDVLSFQFGNYLIDYKFLIRGSSGEDKDESFFSFNLINKFETIESLIEKKVVFTAMEIKSYEFLAHRADSETGRSITNEMFFCLKELNKFNSDIVEKKTVNIEFGDPMCDGAGNYQFSINIKAEYFWNFKFAKFVLNLFGEDFNEIPSFYYFNLRSEDKVTDDKNLFTLTTSTKVRRLGYFKILSRFVSKNKRIPILFLNKKFEKFCLDYQELLTSNIYKKGLINQTKTGISAKPYIDVAIGLKFLNKLNNIIQVDKSFRVYQILENDYSSSNNIFELSEFDRLFFLETILRHDYFYFSNLLELIYLANNATYQNLNKDFKDQIIGRLKEYKDELYYNDRKTANNIDAVLNRIKSWDSSVVYLEHILMPRINWMLDLGIVKGSNTEFSITNAGEKLFQNLCVWNDIRTEKIISSDAFIDHFIMHVFEDCFKVTTKNETINENLILERVYYYINESFEFFQTLAPNRVTASQAINYTRYKLYFNDNIKVGYLFILTSLSEKVQEEFIFKYQEQYNDGYIQKRTK